MSWFNYFASMLLLLLPAWRPRDVPGLAAKGKFRWVVEKSSSLSITGATNINRFACGVAEYGEPDTITCLSEGCRGEARGIPLRGALRINVADFECNNRIMTGEFKKTLRYKEHPQLVIRFLNLEKIPVFDTRPVTIKGCVSVELAGVIKQFDIDYVAHRAGETDAQLIGCRDFGFSDFGLQPPQKMGGLIRVKDSLNVRFNLCLRALD